MNGFPRTLLPIASLSCLFLLGGCLDNRMPRLDRNVPTHWRHAAAATPARPPVDLHDWWKAFHDPQLEQLVDQALKHNPDVAIATEHLRAARALYGTRMAQLRPQLQLRTDNPIDPDATSSYFLIGFDASWELGLFGRGQAVDRVASGRYREAVENLRAVRVSLVAEVVRNVIQLRAAQRQEHLLDAIVKVRERQVELLRTRARLELSDRADLAAAQAELAQAQAALSGPRIDADHAAQRLALLLGRNEPQPAWLQPAPLPQLGPHGPVVAPAELLRTRPGIALAEARVIEAAGHLGIARADLYPHIGLGASLVWSLNINRYRRHGGAGESNDIGTAGPLISVPLFDWGLRQSRKHAQGHLLKAAVLAYRKAVLTGVTEVETALGSLTQLRQREAASEAACASWKQSADLQRTRRRLGLASDLDSADIHIGQARAQMALTDARMQRDMAYIALYKALGGAPPLPARDDSTATAQAGKP